MRYRITNITNAYLTLEPPSLFKRGEVTYREYANIPDRIAYLKEKGLIEIVPVGPPEINLGNSSKNSEIVQIKPIEIKQSIDPVLPTIELNKNLQFKISNVVYDIEVINVPEMKHNPNKMFKKEAL
jgi:hypothetical protein